MKRPSTAKISTIRADAARNSSWNAASSSQCTAQRRRAAFRLACQHERSRADPRRNAAAARVAQPPEHSGLVGLRVIQARADDDEIAFGAVADRVIDRHGHARAREDRGAVDGHENPFIERTTGNPVRLPQRIKHWRERQHPGNQGARKKAILSGSATAAIFSRALSLSLDVIALVGLKR